MRVKVYPYRHAITLGEERDRGQWQWIQDEICRRLHILTDNHTTYALQGTPPEWGLPEDCVVWFHDWSMIVGEKATPSSNWDKRDAKADWVEI